MIGINGMDNHIICKGIEYIISKRFLKIGGNRVGGKKLLRMKKELKKSSKRDLSLWEDIALVTYLKFKEVSVEKTTKYFITITPMIFIAMYMAITYFSTRELKPLYVISNPSAISSVAYSSDGSLIVSACFDGNVKIFNSTTGTVFEQLPYKYNEFGEADLVCFSLNKRYLASAHLKNNVICIWDLKKHQLKTKLFGHTSIVNSMVFSPKTDFLASGSRDGKIKIWDLATNKAKYTLQDENIISLAVSPDGKMLVSDSWVGGVAGSGEKRIF
jgi:WD40 repeat protein